MSAEGVAWLLGGTGRGARPRALKPPGRHLCCWQRVAQQRGRREGPGPRAWFCSLSAPHEGLLWAGKFLQGRALVVISSKGIGTGLMRA